MKSLIESKLQRCGWRSPAMGGTDFYAECRDTELNRVFGLEPAEFRRWLENRLRIDPPARHGERPTNRPR